MIKEIEVGDLVRVAPNHASYGSQSDIVGLVIGFVSTTSALRNTPIMCARVEWLWSGAETVSGLPVLELVRQ